jgi:hypothetical protein
VFQKEKMNETSIRRIKIPSHRSTPRIKPKEESEKKVDVLLETARFFRKKFGVLSGWDGTRSELYKTCGADSDVKCVKKLFVDAVNRKAPGVKKPKETHKKKDTRKKKSIFTRTKKVESAVDVTEVAQRSRVHK